MKSHFFSGKLCIVFVLLLLATACYSQEGDEPEGLSDSFRGDSRAGESPEPVVTEATFTPAIMVSEPASGTFFEDGIASGEEDTASATLIFFTKEAMRMGGFMYNIFDVPGSGGISDDWANATNQQQNVQTTIISDYMKKYKKQMQNWKIPSSSTSRRRKSSNSSNQFRLDWNKLLK